MCLITVGFSISDIIDSMETFQSEDKQVLKDCCVVLVPLLDDVIRRRTVTVSTNDDVLASKESSTSNLTVDNCTEKKDIKEINVLPISVFSKIDNGIITEVWCKRFRKRKCDVQLEMETDEEIILDIMKCMLDRISEKPVNKTQSIDFSSPGIREIELIKDFCHENGYELNDYQDLDRLFTFRTLPLVEVTKLIKSKSSNRRKTQKKKSPTKRTEILRLEKNESIEVSKTQSSNNFKNSGLEKIENLKIRKILEDFGRLSKSEENIHVPKQKKSKTESSYFLNNSFINKPLNLCKKDDKDNDKPVKINKSVQSDISISGSILRTLLYNQNCAENLTKNHPKEPQDKNAYQQTSMENSQKKTTKKSTAQQTDLDSFLEEKIPIIEKNQNVSNVKNDKWLNDPTVILKKIQKLRKDILYLDLLAEEKEKERIAILCFKNYKESILKKIFASEMSEDISNVSETQTNVINSPSTTIPKLIHPTNNSISNVNALNGRSLNSTPLIFPSTTSHLHRQSSCSSSPDKSSVGINSTNENCIRLGNCIKCDLLKANILNSKYRNIWYCNPLCQVHSGTQHVKECLGFLEEASSSK